MAEVYAYHQEKVAFLRSNGYNVEVMWSCEWKNLRETDDQAQFVLLALNFPTFPVLATGSLNAVTYWVCGAMSSSPVKRQLKSLCVLVRKVTLTSQIQVDRR